MSVTVEAHMQYPFYFRICFQSFIKKKKKTDYRPKSQGKAVPAHTNTTYIPAMQKWPCCPVLKLSHTLPILLDFARVPLSIQRMSSYPYLPTITPSPAVNPSGPSIPSSRHAAFAHSLPYSHIVLLLYFCHI